jgi:hypothetical protein
LLENAIGIGYHEPGMREDEIEDGKERCQEKYSLALIEHPAIDRAHKHFQETHPTGWITLHDLNIEGSHCSPFIGIRRIGDTQEFWNEFEMAVPIGFDGLESCQHLIDGR